MIKINASIKGINLIELERSERAEEFYNLTEPTETGRTPKVIANLPNFVIKGIQVDINGDGSAYYKPEKTRVIDDTQWLLELVKVGFVFDLVIFKFVQAERYLSPDIEICGLDVVSQEPPTIGAPWNDAIVTNVNGLVDHFGNFSGYLIGEDLESL